jgi:hypothetical protein
VAKPIRLSRVIGIALAAATGLGCARAPNPVALMSPMQLRSVLDKDLCVAYDGGNQTPSIQQEVSRRRLNCGRVLLDAGIEPQRIDVGTVVPLGDCGGAEFLGVFFIGPPWYVCDNVDSDRRCHGVHGQWAEIRNGSGVSKKITVAFFLGGSQHTASMTVKAGQTEELQIASYETPEATSARIASCDSVLPPPPPLFR